MMRRRRSSNLSLVVLIIALLLCIWLLYRLFIGLPPAPPPQLKTALAVSTDGRDKNVAATGGCPLVGETVKWGRTAVRPAPHT